MIHRHVLSILTSHVNASFITKRRISHSIHNLLLKTFNTISRQILLTTSVASQVFLVPFFATTSLFSLSLAHDLIF